MRQIIITTNTKVMPIINLVLNCRFFMEFFIGSTQLRKVVKKGYTIVYATSNFLNNQYMVKCTSI